MSLEDVQCVVGKFVAVYNTQRLHSAIGYVTPQGKLDGREEFILPERKHKLAETLEARAHCPQSVQSERFLVPPLDGPKMGMARAA